MTRVVAMLAADPRDAAVLSAVRALVARGAERVTLAHACAPGTDTAERERRMRAEVGALGDAHVDATARIGEAHAVAEAVLAEGGADLLVIGRSAGEDGASAWGENGRTLLRAAGCPVLVVPADAGEVRLGRVAVGMDLSEPALDALAAAGRLCEAPEAIAVLAPEDAPGADPAALRDALAGKLAAALAARELSPVPLRAIPGPSPADVLLGVEDEFDLLAVGSRGLSPLATVFLGSTAERLAGRSRRPVLVVRRRGGTRGLFGALFGS